MPPSASSSSALHNMPRLQIFTCVYKRPAKAPFVIATASSAKRSRELWRHFPTPRPSPGSPRANSSVDRLSRDLVRPSNTARVECWKIAILLVSSQLRVSPMALTRYLISFTARFTTGTP